MVAMLQNPDSSDRSSRAGESRRILILCPFPVGTVPAQRLKYEQYFDDWRLQGYEVTVSSFFDLPTYSILYSRRNLGRKVVGTLRGYGRRVRDLYRARRFAVVYVFLWVTPFGPPISERFLSMLNSHIVYDIDDLIFDAGSASPSNRFVSWLKGRKKPQELMRAASVVITSTPYLSTFARRFSANVCEISCTVDTDRLRRDLPPDNDVPVIGWSGSFSTSKYLERIGPELQSLAHDHDFILRVVGVPNFSLDGVNVDVVPWTAEGERDALASFDVGLHPIDRERWALGKSGGKVFLYLSLGIPVVASAVGPNHRSVSPGSSGFLIYERSEWVEVLAALLLDRDLRLTLGTQARERAVEWFSVERHIPFYRSVLEAAATGGPCPVSPSYPDPADVALDQL